MKCLGGLLCLLVVGLGCSQAPTPISTEEPSPTWAPDPHSELARIGDSTPPPAEPEPSLAEARKGFQTKLVRKMKPGDPLEIPPPDLFQIVHYESAVGKLPAYLSAAPDEPGKRPAIIWITGGDCNSIGDVWSDMPPEFDQSASAYRKAGIIMMFPSLRGGNENPGEREGLFGEVDDVIAAADFLSKQENVDPKRIYLGGHSSGGTLVLLVSEITDRFRAVFAFGPSDTVEGYGEDLLPCDLNDEKEIELRSPVHWLNCIRSPTFVFEGGLGGNKLGLINLKTSKQNRQGNDHFIFVPGNHFSALAPANRVIAKKVLQDNGEECNLKFTMDEFLNAVK